MTLKNKIFVFQLATFLLAGCSTTAAPRFAPSFQNKPASVITQPIALINTTEDQLHPSLSKASHHLAYAAQIAGNLDIYIQSAIPGANPVRLTEHSTDDTSPVFSPDSQKLVWVSKRADVKGDLWLMNVDGSSQRKLTTRTSGDSTPVFHPDGAHIFFTSRLKNKRRPGIEKLNISTGLSQVVVEQGWNPTLSSDGTYMAFVAVEPGETIARLYLRNLLTSKTRPITQTIYPEGLPTFIKRPNGDEELIFVRFIDDINGDGSIDVNDTPSLWSAPFNQQMRRPGPPPTPRPLTPVLDGEIFVRPGDAWLVYTAAGLGDLDIFALPFDGMLSPELDASALLGAASVEPQPALRRFILRHIIATAPKLQAKAYYLLAREYANIGSIDLAIDILKQARSVSQNELNGWDLTLEISELELKKVIGDDTLVRTDAARKALKELELTAHDAISIQDTTLTKHANLLLATAARIRGNTILAFKTWQSLSQDKSIPEQWQAKSILGLIELSLEMGDLDATEKLVTQLTKPRYASESHIRDRAIDKWLTTLVAQSLTNPYGELETIIHRHRRNPVIATRAGILQAVQQQQEGNNSSAQRRLQNLVDTWPNAGMVIQEVLEKLADAAIANGDFDASLRALDLLLEKFPSHRKSTRKARQIIARIALGEAEQAERDGDMLLARKLYRRLLRTSNSNATAHRRYITLSAETNNLPKAQSYYREAVRQNPRDRYARYGLGMVLTYLLPKNLGRAEEQFERALSLYARFPEAHLALGWVRMQLEQAQPGDGLLEQAIESFQTAKDLVDAQTNPELWSALHLNEGNALMVLGKTDAAFASFLEREQTGYPFRSPLRKLLFLEQFGRAAMHEEVWDVALDMTQTALGLSQTLLGKPRQADLMSRLGAIEFMLGHYHRAQDALELALKNVDPKNIGRRLALLRSLAQAQVLQGGHHKAAQTFKQALRVLKQNPKLESATARDSSWFYTEVPGDPNDVTAAILGFNASQESLLVHRGLAKLAVSQGRFESARKYANTVVASLRISVNDSATGQRIRLELLFALNMLARLEAINGNYTSALTLWEQALKLSKTLALPDKTITILESLQELSVRSGVARDHNGAWIALANENLENEELPKPLHKRFSRFLTLAYSRRALGTTRIKKLNPGPAILESFLELTHRSEALILAEKHASETPDNPLTQEVGALFSLETTNLSEQIKHFIENQTGAINNRNRYLVQEFLNKLSPETESLTIYQIAEKWRLLNLPSEKALTLKAGSSSTQHAKIVQKIRQQLPAELKEVQAILGPQEALLQVVTVSANHTVWIWHDQKQTLVQTQGVPLEHWLESANVQRLYLDLASTSLELEQTVMSELEKNQAIQTVFTPSATWLIFNKGLRAIAQGLPLSVVEPPAAVGMNASGIAIALEDLRDYSAHHPIVNLDLNVRQDTPGSHFSSLEIVMGNDENSMLTLGELVTYDFRAQVVIVNNAPPNLKVREAIATRLHFAGSVAVVFTASKESTNELLERLSQANSLGLSEALLSVKGIQIHGQPGLEPHQVVTQAVASFNTAFRKGLRAFKAAQKSKSSQDWSKAGAHFETLMKTLDVITTREAKALLKDLTLLPELQSSPRLQKVARVLPKQSGQLQLVARDKLSNIRAAQGQFSEAIALRELLTAAFAAQGLHKKAARSLQEQGNVYLAQGNRDRATRSFQECATFSAMAGIVKQEARCLTRAARTLNRSGKPKLAKQEFEKAITLFQSISSPEEISTRRSLGHLFESSLSDYVAAENVYEQTLKLAESRQDERQIRSIKLDQVRLLYTKGQYSKAMRALEHALESSSKLEPREKLTLRLELAKVAWYQGDYSKARQAQRIALSTARQFGWTFQEIQARSLGGLIAMNLGDLNAARIAMLDALGLARRTGRLNEVAIQANNLGNVLRERGQYNKALDYYQQALKIENNANNLEGRAYAIRNMGLTYARMGLYHKAQGLLQEALSLSQSIGNRYNELQCVLAIAEVKEKKLDPSAEFSWTTAAHLARLMALPEALWRSLYGMGRTTKDKLKAELFYEGAILVVEELGGGRGQALSEYSPTSLYHRAITLARSQRDESRIFDLSERQKLREFSEKLPASSRADQKRAELNAARAIYRSNVFTKIFDEPVKSLNAAQLAYQKARSLYFKNNEATVTKGAPAPIQMESIQQYLPAGVSMLIVNSGEREVTTQLIHRTRVKTSSTNLNHQEFSAALAQISEAMKNFGPIQEPLKDLSEALLGPAQEVIKQGDHLIVILPEAYSQLPLSALTLGSRPLMEQVTISAAPSATFLFTKLRLKAPTAPEKIYAMAPAEDLPFAKLELNHIQSQQLGEITVFQDPLDALHLAGHVRNRGLSYFETGPESSISSSDVLNASQVPSLVTLSACEGLYKASFLSLSHAFLINGAQTVVAHSHRVSDLAAAIFMKHFYRNLKLGRAKALQQAALKTKAYFPHPAHWGGFQLLGDFR